MPNTVISGPVPLYQNFPIQAQFYAPSVFNISAITLGQFTIVTTSINHNYVIGQLVRLLIPNGYGSRALNEQTGYVVSIPAPNQVTLNLSSYNVSAFINANLPTAAQIVAVGDVNMGYISKTGRIVASTNIPGSFINISPM